MVRASRKQTQGDRIDARLTASPVIKSGRRSLARAALFLVSSDGRVVNGVNLNVDGGMSLRSAERSGRVAGFVAAGTSGWNMKQASYNPRSSKLEIWIPNVSSVADAFTVLS